MKSFSFISILFMPDPAEGGGKAKEKALKDQLDEANATIKDLQSQVAKFEADKKQASEDEKLILEKMRAGLTREQAISTIKRQRDFDARKKEAEEQAKAKAADAEEAPTKPAKK